MCTLHSAHATADSWYPRYRISVHVISLTSWPKTCHKMLKNAKLVIIWNVDGLLVYIGIGLNQMLFRTAFFAEVYFSRSAAFKTFAASNVRSWRVFSTIIILDFFLIFADFQKPQNPRKIDPREKKAVLLYEYCIQYWKPPCLMSKYQRNRCNLFSFNWTDPWW